MARVCIPSVGLLYHQRRRLLQAVFGLAIVSPWLTFFSATATASPQERIDYWQKNYDELLPQDDPRAARAHDIFQRIVNAAGKRPGVMLRLYITNTNPWNISLPIAIPDGWVILSKGALDICYRNPQRGDDRLAFVLAHEIAHHLKDDFWHMKFFQAIDASKTNDPQQDKVLEEVRGIAGLTEKVLAKELQADEYGIVYASIAGFNTDAIVSEDDTVNFFEDWVRALDPGRITGVHTDSSHPTPQQRSTAVKARLRQILAKVEVFNWGWRFYQAGDYQHAVHAFGEFVRFFPSREVYHNLSTSHHQLALQYYRQWKKDGLTLPWKLSLAIDPVTRASGISLRGSRSPAELFKAHLDKAIEFYRTAIALDPAYALAYNNLGCALILKEDVYKAIAMFQDALTAAPNFTEALNNLGVAFLYAENSGKAKAYLAKAHELSPEYDAPLFNLGKLAYEEHNALETKKYWMAYLDLDPASPWADAIRRTLSLSRPEADWSSSAIQAAEGVMGVSVGALKDEVPPEWGEPSQMRDIPLEGEPFKVAIYNNGVSALFLHDEIRMLVTLAGYRGSSALGISIGSVAPDLRARYGTPSRVVTLRQGQGWVYDEQGIAFQLGEGKVVSWQLF